MKWTEYVQNNKKSLLSKLSTRLSALKKVTKVSNFKTRLMIANGIFMSKLHYMMPLWGGCEGYLLKSLQIVQNKAARAVTKQNWETPVKTLLNQCNWLSVRQLVMYHSLILLFKVIQTKCPKYIHKKLSVGYSRETRQAETNASRIIVSKGFPLELASNSFRWRTADQWNNLPVTLRNIKNLKTFKTKLKIWIKENVPI